VGETGFTHVSPATEAHSKSKSEQNNRRQSKQGSQTLKDCVGSAANSRSCQRETNLRGDPKNENKTRLTQSVSRSWRDGYAPENEMKSFSDV